MSTLKDYYNSTVAPAMMKKFNYETDESAKNVSV